MKATFLDQNFLANTNKKYAKKTPLLIIFLGVIFYISIFLFFCYTIFNLIFLKAQVVGISMIPTYNTNLNATTVYDSEYYQNSPYKDIVFANRFQKGSNGDIILLELNNELVIKRIIASAGQTVKLKKGNETTDLFNYYYYVDDVLINEPYIYSRNDMDLSYFNRFCYSSNRNFTANIVTPGIEAEFVVPEGEVFVLGDNRLVSGDSLIYGTVKTNKIYGKVAFSYKYNQNFWGFIWQKIVGIL